MKLRLTAAVVVVVIALGMLTLAPAGAAVHRVSQDDCAALDNIGQIQTSLTDSGSSNFAATASALKATAKKVSDKQLKAALLKMAAVYAALAKSKGKAALALGIARNARKYASAVGVLTKALVGCETAKITVPTIGPVPAVTLPPGVTLPNGVTLPRQ